MLESSGLFVCLVGLVHFFSAWGREKSAGLWFATRGSAPRLTLCNKNESRILLTTTLKAWTGLQNLSWNAIERHLVLQKGNQMHRRDGRFEINKVCHTSFSTKNQYTIRHLLVKCQQRKQKNVCNMFKVNNKDIRTTLMNDANDVVWCF